MSKLNLKGKFVVAFDTIVDGNDCTKDEHGKPVLYNSADEAFKEIFSDALSMLENRSEEELEECNEGVTKEHVKRMAEAFDSGDVALMRIFLDANPNCNDNNEFVVPAEEFIMGRKAIFTTEGLVITGKKL